MALLVTHLRTESQGYGCFAKEAKEYGKPVQRDYSSVLSWLAVVKTWENSHLRTLGLPVALA